MATRTGVGRDLSPIKKGIKVGVGVGHCCASLELDRQNILLMDYITGLIVLGINITLLLSSTVYVSGVSRKLGPMYKAPRFASNFTSI